MKVSNKTLQEIIILKNTELKISKYSYNLGEPWDGLHKFMDENICDLLEELLDYRKKIETGELS